ncbi:hypothetical protein [Natronosalvus vescus]|nr:hypothetical protein [Natronosalvus vescus]
MQFLQYNGSKAEWYDSTITGYIVTASAISIGLSAVMALGVI